MQDDGPNLHGEFDPFAAPDARGVAGRGYLPATPFSPSFHLAGASAINGVKMLVIEEN